MKASVGRVRQEGREEARAKVTVTDPATPAWLPAWPQDRRPLEGGSGSTCCPRPRCGRNTSSVNLNRCQVSGVESGTKDTNLG